MEREVNRWRVHGSGNAKCSIIFGVMAPCETVHRERDRGREMGGGGRLPFALRTSQVLLSLILGLCRRPPICIEMYQMFLEKYYLEFVWDDFWSSEKVEISRYDHVIRRHAQQRHIQPPNAGQRSSRTPPPSWRARYRTAVHR